MVFTLFYICLLVFFIDSIIGFMRWKYMDKAMKTFLVLITLSFLSEVVGAFVETKMQTKAPVYHFFSIAAFSFYTFLFPDNQY